MPRPFEMLFLVTYDIPSDRAGQRRRARLAKFLEGRGLRVQWSVFEVPMAPEKLPLLCDQIQSLTKASQDSVRIYPLCASCAQRCERIGIDAPVERDGLIVW